jgi:hypothetical protein
VPDFASLCGDLLQTGLSVRLAATGQSMGPVIRDGDVVTIEPCTGDDLRRGDVAFYATPRGPTLHRVLRRSGGLLVVRGDAVGSPVEPVSPSAVLGRVASVCRDGRPVPLRVPWAVRLRWLARRALARV